MQAAGTIPPGVHVSYLATPFKQYVDELNKRGINIREVKREEGRGKREEGSAFPAPSCFLVLVPQSARFRAVSIRLIASQ